MADWAQDQRAQERADAYRFSEHILAERRDSAWLSALPMPRSAPDAVTLGPTLGCDIWQLGHIVPNDDQAGQWCETHKVKFGAGEKCPKAKEQHG